MIYYSSTCHEEEQSGRACRERCEDFGVVVLFVFHIGTRGATRTMLAMPAPQADLLAFLSSFIFRLTTFATASMSFTSSWACLPHRSSTTCFLKTRREA